MESNSQEIKNNNDNEIGRVKAPVNKTWAYILSQNITFKLN